MGPAFQRMTRAHPLVVPWTAGLCLGGRVFSHLHGRFQYVQVPGEGAQKYDFPLGNFLDVCISSGSGTYYTNIIEIESHLGTLSLVF